MQQEQQQEQQQPTTQESRKQWIDMACSFFDYIRRQLHCNGISELALDFPVSAMPFEHELPLSNLSFESVSFEQRQEMEESLRQARLNNYMGLTLAIHSDWVKKGASLQIAKNNKIHLVCIRIFTEPNEKEQEIKALPMSALIATLLHEFAHCITAGCIQHGGIDELGKKKRKWIELHHHAEFYNNFARILKVAASLDIYHLPSKANKYSLTNLKRFDALDSFTIVGSGLLGDSPIWDQYLRTGKLTQNLNNDNKNKNNNNNNNNNDNNHASNNDNNDNNNNNNNTNDCKLNDNNSIPNSILKANGINKNMQSIRINLQNKATKQQKIVVLKSRQMKQLNTVVKQKFRKKAKLITTLQGLPIKDDNDINQLQNDCLLLVQL